MKLTCGFSRTTSITSKICEEENNIGKTRWRMIKRSINQIMTKERIKYRYMVRRKCMARMRIMNKDRERGISYIIFTSRRL